MNCLVDRTKRQLHGLLIISQQPGWRDGLDVELDAILGHSSSNIFSCPCTSCQGSLTTENQTSDQTQDGVHLEQMHRYIRLLATCIIADYPFLIFKLASKGFDDAQFNSCTDAFVISAIPGITEKQAKRLFALKHSFLDGGRVNLFRYLRSTRPNQAPPGKRDDVPSDAERNWLLDEMLELLRILALPQTAAERKLPEDCRIGDITIRIDPERMAADRHPKESTRVNMCHGLITVQSVGYLILDLIGFIIKGGYWIWYQDAKRGRPGNNYNWAKKLPLEELTGQPGYRDLIEAFELAWIMIQEDQDFTFPQIPGRNTFEYIYEQFAKVWSLTRDEEGENFETIRADRFSTTTLSSFSTMNLRNLGTSHAPEISPEIFRWIILRYGKEGEPGRPCRMQIFRSRDSSMLRLQIFDFGINPLLATSCNIFVTALTSSLYFVPIFAFQISGFSVTVKRRSTLLRQRHFLEANVGTVQVLQVLNDHNLDYIHRRAKQSHRGLKGNPVRLEIAVYTEDKLLVVIVSYLLIIRELDDFVLQLDSKEPRMCPLEGKQFDVMNWAGDPIYPGISLFQKAPFNSQEAGQSCKLESLKLNFKDKKSRDDFSGLLYDRYKAEFVKDFAPSIFKC
ncbi:hypothetical protein BGZ60DRAFT_515286 [Tricladium varicosporioides]|nr:hypothetical protein BGZ60DRAFT_515286 [Hymenoscyphus varicosporioides]